MENKTSGKYFYLAILITKIDTVEISLSYFDNRKGSVKIIPIVIYLNNHKAYYFTCTF